MIDTNVIVRHLNSARGTLWDTPLLDLTNFEEAAMVDRVRFYMRRHGMDVDTAAETAWVWHDNLAEQRDRRVSHDTGAT